MGTIKKCTDIVNAFGLSYFYRQNGKKDIAKVVENILAHLVMSLITKVITRFNSVLFNIRFC